MNYPKISIITPSYNQAKYLEQTMQSVIGQGYPNLEYIVMDGGSTDNSVEIIRKYEKYLFYWESKLDNGMYHAIQKGFEKSSGDIMAWINSDDIYHTKALFTVGEIFTNFPYICWLTGSMSHIDESNRIIRALGNRKWSKFNFYRGDYKWIQQESTFWHRKLWEKAGSCINDVYPLAADFELWVRFFRYEKLYSVETALGAFRIRRQQQKSAESIDNYMQEMQEIISREPVSIPDQKKIKYLQDYEKYIRKIPFFRSLPYIQRTIKNIYDYPPMLYFDRNAYTFVIGQSVETNKAV